MIDRSENRVVFIDHTNPGSAYHKEKVRIITLKHNSWLLAGFDEGSSITENYKLQSLGKKQDDVEVQVYLDFQD